MTSPIKDTKISYKDSSRYTMHPYTKAHFHFANFVKKKDHITPALHILLLFLLHPTFECRKTKNQSNQTTDAVNPMNQSELVANTCSRRQARENACTIGFGFTSDWLRKWREIFKPTTKHRNEKPRQMRNYFRLSNTVVFGLLEGFTELHLHLHFI